MNKLIVVLCIIFLFSCDTKQLTPEQREIKQVKNNNYFWEICYKGLIILRAGSKYSDSSVYIYRLDENGKPIKCNEAVIRD